MNRRSSLGRAATGAVIVMLNAAKHLRRHPVLLNAAKHRLRYPVMLNAVKHLLRPGEIPRCARDDRRRKSGGGAGALAVFACCIILLTAGRAAAQGKAKLTVGSKAFPESWILGEAIAALARDGGDAAVEHADNLGGTDVVYAALKKGAVDVYPEYTGTIVEAILKSPGRPSMQQMRSQLAREGLGISDSLGFNDGYALAVTQSTAAKYGLGKMSELAAHPELRFGFTHEFLERKDGWPGLAAHYGLTTKNVGGIEHALAYEAIRSRQIDVMEIYTTDAQIQRLGLKILEDDRRFFPRYDAVLFYRLDLPKRAPRAFEAMERLVGKISEEQMIRANGMVVLEKRKQEEAGAALLRDALGSGTAVTAQAPARRSVAESIVENTITHLRLVGIALLASILVGVPVGVLATKSRALAAVVLSFAGVLQTIPSLALLAFLIPLLGIGQVPALVALFLYGLLPIVRNTYIGLTTIPGNLAEAAQALGLSPAAQLLKVSLPMASPSIMAGIKTSAVISVGTATLAALIRAGGLGDPIWRGMQTVNTDLILQGAIPAALLALAVQGAFDLLDRLVIPKGLRLPPARD
jgi:osmoprotectant transport system permease protein